MIKIHFLVFFSDLREKAVSFSTLSILLAVDISWIFFIMLRKLLYIPSFPNNFILKGYFVRCFSVPVDMVTYFRTYNFVKLHSTNMYSLLYVNHTSVNQHQSKYIYFHALSNEVENSLFTPSGVTHWQNFLLSEPH